MPRTLSYITHLQIRFSDCDPLKIVWHGNYVKYFEDGREAFGKAFDFTYLEIYSKNGLSVPLVHLEMDYKRPVSFGETISIEAKMVDDPAAKIVFEYVIRNSANQVLCTGKTIQAFVQIEKNELQITMPAFFEAWKNKFLK
ncbi:MAG: acyl-CoA thioesterase [bacterium]|nr:acyl-CoA thioesterase [bacterium]